MDVTVRDNADQLRFELLLDGEPAGLAAYRVRDGITVITHSEIDPAHRGKGLGNDLARQTLDTLRAQGARIRPACRFFAKYVAEHPEYADLVED
jgi:predicted GNAT family acetyltransferase